MRREEFFFSIYLYFQVARDFYQQTIEIENTERDQENDMHTYELKLKFDNFSYIKFINTVKAADVLDGLPAPEAKVLIKLFPFCIVFDKNFKLIVSWFH